uniref:DYW domain-containing protein n=1 Tax=Salix viminalis TaxID=40686 RepID=A0A6N2L655_SALVM
MISGYATNSKVDVARKLFEVMLDKTWTVMLTGREVFQDMFSSSIAPDEITFIGVLSGCSYTVKYQVDPKTEHYTCMIDLHGRAGKLNEAMNLIENMPVEAFAIVWGCFIRNIDDKDGALYSQSKHRFPLRQTCRTHKNLDLAEIEAKKLLQLEPNNAGPYILLSNIYASRSRWKDAVELRKTMRAWNLRKSPVNKKVRVFSGGGSTSHPEHEMILKKLGKLDALLREAGYVPDGSFDVDEEEKVDSLPDHGEKLAVAYGLLKVPEGMPICAMKNLRVCGDCHAAIKLIA